jgi:hypothetical protein
VERERFMMGLIETGGARLLVEMKIRVSARSGAETADVELVAYLVSRHPTAVRAVPSSSATSGERNGLHVAAAVRHGAGIKHMTDAVPEVA